jgi:hypothetical protein
MKMRYYLVSWDCLGVEFLDDITKYHPDNWAKANLLNAIKNNQMPDCNYPNLFPITMRARMNGHRHYEIYVFTSEDGIGEEDIRAWFETDPQGFADWVREHHTVKIWDERAKVKPAIV